MSLLKKIIILFAAAFVCGCQSPRQEMLRLLNSKIVFGDYLSRLDTHSNSYFKNSLSSNFKILAVIKQSE